MQLIIQLQKEIDETEEGRQIYKLVKQRLQDRTDVKVQGWVTNHFPLED